MAIDTFIGSLPPHLGDGLAQLPRTCHRRARDAALFGELEDPLRTRVDRLVHRVAEARHLLAGCVDTPRRLDRLLIGLEQARTLGRRADDNRPDAQDPRSDRSLERFRVGRERHPRRDIGRHHPVLRECDQHEIQEEALLLGRLAAREQEVEVLGEGQPAHQVAGEVAPAHLDPVRVGLADVSDGFPGLADLHTGGSLALEPRRRAP